MKERRVGNLLAVFALYLLEDQLVFIILAGETGYLASLKLELSFISNMSTL